jgi:hypothetical protein
MTADPSTIAGAITTLRDPRHQETGWLDERQAGAVDVIYRNYGRMLQRVARQIVGTDGDAEDGCTKCSAAFRTSCQSTGATASEGGSNGSPSAKQ